MRRFFFVIFLRISLHVLFLLCCFFVVFLSGTLTPNTFPSSTICLNVTICVLEHVEVFFWGGGADERYVLCSVFVQKYIFLL